MKKLKILILIFCLALSVPLGYFVLRTYWSLEQEEISELRYFAVTLFDQIEEELASLVLKEEGRPVDQYRYYYAPSQGISARQNLVPSPLSQPYDPHPGAYSLRYGGREEPAPDPDPEPG